MKVIIGSRGTGKTSRLVEIASKNGYYIAVKNREQAERIFALSKDMRFDIRFPITFAELLHYRGKDVGVIIDNVEEFIQSMTDITVKAVSINSDDVECRFINPMIPNNLVFG